MSNEKDLIIHLIAGFHGDTNVKVYLSNYATKANVKNISHLHTSSFALKSNLASLKTEVDKLDVEKLVPVAVDLSKLSDVVKNDVVTKASDDKLVKKVNNIHTSGFVLKTKYDADKTKLKNKILDTNELVKKTNYNAKITEREGKILSISGLATNAALTAVKPDLKIKIPNISSLVKKKTDYNTKITKLKNLHLNLNLHIIIMTNILLLQSLISLQQQILLQD